MRIELNFFRRYEECMVYPNDKYIGFTVLKILCAFKYFKLYDLFFKKKKHYFKKSLRVRRFDAF